MNDTQIIILAAGKGKRMGNRQLPKVLTRLAGRPIISYLLDEVNKLGSAYPPIIVVGYRQEMVRQTLGADYDYAVQHDQLGTAHAVAAAREDVRARRIVVLYGDMPFIKAESILQLRGLHEANRSPLSLLTSIVPDFEGPFESLKDFGRILRADDGTLLEIREVKDASEEEKAVPEVNPGIYMFDTAWLWSRLEKIGNHNAQKEFYLTDIVPLALADGYRIPSLPIDAHEILGINTPAQLSAAEDLARFVL